MWRLFRFWRRFINPDIYVACPNLQLHHIVSLQRVKVMKWERIYSKMDTLTLHSSTRRVRNIWRLLHLEQAYDQYHCFSLQYHVSRYTINTFHTERILGLLFTTVDEVVISFSHKSFETNIYKANKHTALFS